MDSLELVLAQPLVAIVVHHCQSPKNEHKSAVCTASESASVRNRGSNGK
jgi:type II secretory ATPase GspE/PulE/Tfp pilus assembly ATPase PilB-like protein